MSRVGESPITVPQGVQVTLENSRVQVQGPKGTLAQDLPTGITCSLEGDQLVVRRQNDTKSQKSLHGLLRSLLANAVRGTSTGFAKELQIEGIGYRAELKGSDLTLSLGYSHPVIYAVPKNIALSVEKQTRISVSGYDKQQVGQVAAEIRALRPPEPYKGKGIRYVGEWVRRKVGKTGA